MVFDTANHQPASRPCFTLASYNRAVGRCFKFGRGLVAVEFSVRHFRDREGKMLRSAKIYVGIAVDRKGKGFQGYSVGRRCWNM